MGSWPITQKLTREWRVRVMKSSRDEEYTMKRSCIEVVERPLESTGRPPGGW